MHRWSNVDLHLVPNPGMPEPHPKREGAMEYPNDLPGDLILEEFYALADRCYRLGKRDDTWTLFPSAFVALAIATVLLAATHALLLFGAALLAVWLTLWRGGAWILRRTVTRRQLRRACDAVDRFAQEHRLSHERVRTLWYRVWELRSRVAPLGMFEDKAERAILACLPYLRAPEDVDHASEDSGDSPA